MKLDYDTFTFQDGTFTFWVVSRQGVDQVVRHPEGQAVDPEWRPATREEILTWMDNNVEVMLEGLHRGRDTKN